MGNVICQSGKKECDHDQETRASQTTFRGCLVLQYRAILPRRRRSPDRRGGSIRLLQADALMSGLAMFALKDPSMLAFDQRRQADEKNLQMIFGMANVPSDTRMREILDPVDPEHLRPAFRNVFT